MRRSFNLFGKNLLVGTLLGRSTGSCRQNPGSLLLAYRTTAWTPSATPCCEAWQNEGGQSGNVARVIFAAVVRAFQRQPDDLQGSRHAAGLDQEHACERPLQVDVPTFEAERQ